MTEPDARELIAQNFPAVWSDLWDGRTTAAAFKYSGWAKPRNYFVDPDELQERAPGLAGLCPLFERNGDAVIGWLPDRNRFIEFHYEDGDQGDDAIGRLGDNYQQFVFSRLLELEDAGMRDEWLTLADAARFAHTAALVEVLDRSPYDECAIEELKTRI